MKRVFVYGSCTTRDGVDYWDEYGLELDGYVARQSLVSGYAPTSQKRFDMRGISSSFVRRMIANDAAGTAPQKALEAVRNGKIVIWDLTDERGGVFEIPQGGLVSGVAQASGVKFVGMKLGPRIAFGSEAFHELWIRAAQKFAADLVAERLLDNVIVNATPWATLFEDGTPGPRSVPEAVAFNAGLARMTQELESLGFKIARPHPDRVRAAHTHKWGQAAFHYTPDTYRAALEAIMEVGEMDV